MKIETKYNIEDEVYFISNNKIIKGVIVSIHCEVKSLRAKLTKLVNSYTTITYNEDSSETWSLAEEDKFFITKEELLKSL